MKIWVGDIVKNEVNRSGKKKTQIAREIPLSRTHLDNILNDDYMELEYVTRIGEVIRHDFKGQLPELSKSFVADEKVEYEPLDNNALKDQLIHLQRRYSELQQEYINTLKDLLNCQRELAAK